MTPKLDRLHATAAVLALSMLVGIAAAAEIYKCVGSDGKLIFTTEEGRCPNAQVHVPKAELQSESSVPPARASEGAQPSYSPDPGGELDDGMEHMWRRKRREAEEELSKVEEGLAEVEELVRGCRKGTKWLVEDKSGLRQHLPCNEINERHAELSQKRQQLTAYLGGGLEEACRRAGCLPGWIRR